MLVLAVVVAVVLVPTIWESVWTDTIECDTWNATTCHGVAGTGVVTNDCYGNACTNESDYCVYCVNGTTKTLLQLVPMLFVALLIIVGVLLSAGYRIPGT